MADAVGARHPRRDISLRDRIATEKELAAVELGKRPAAIVGFEFLENFHRHVTVADGNVHFVHERLDFGPCHEDVINIL
jgi:hypothetical protein